MVARYLLGLLHQRLLCNLGLERLFHDLGLALALIGLLKHKVR